MLRDCITMLREWSTAPVLDISDFLNAVIFNMLIGNADAHGKNYSLLYRQGERRLAPCYDLVCTLAWPELSKTPAMKIGQCDSLDAITPVHWQKMTAEARLGWPMVRERLADLCRALQTALHAPPCVREPEIMPCSSGWRPSSRTARRCCCRLWPERAAPHPAR